ncbi:MAG: flagellar filament capping protein FliD, partial [Pseudomonadota bacterium]
MVAVTGIGSGLDIESLVTGLVDAERVPAETRILEREATLTSELSALGTLQGALAGVQNQIASLNTIGTFNQRTTASSNVANVLATATNTAAAGAFDVEVTTLATAQSLASGSFDALTSTVGEGTLSFRFGSTDYTGPDPGPSAYNGFELNTELATASIEIDSSNNTLSGLRDAINEAAFGVSATIVNDGGGYRLLLSSDNTGAAQSMEIRVSDTGDGDDTDDIGLSQLAFNADADNLTQTVAGTDAQLSINGLSITSDSNSVDDAISGVSLQLLGDTDGEPTRITISENLNAARSAISSFVDSYNGFISTANALTAFDPETGNAGALNGDFTARTLVNQLRTAVTAQVDSVSGAFSSLSEIGITTRGDGTLGIDDARLTAAFDDNFNDVVALFAQVASIDDASIDVEINGDITPVGDYDLVISQLATQGTLSGAAITAPDALTPLVIDASNDRLFLDIDGVSVDVSLIQGSYESGAALAAELQSRINSNTELSVAGASVLVQFTDDNRLQISSNRYGNTSSVAITGVDANTTESLGLSVAAGTDGADAVGTIGGIAASADGQVLSGAEGTDTEGLV